MPLKSHAKTCVRKASDALKSLPTDQRGTVAVIMGFVFPILIAGFGLGFEITNWYLRTRSMQNAADAAAIAAATNGSANYNTEAAAVATQYGHRTYSPVSVNVRKGQAVRLGHSSPFFCPCSSPAERLRHSNPFSHRG